MAERPGNFLRSPRQVLEPVHPSPPPTHYALQEVSAEPAWEHPCSVMGLGVSSVGGRFEVQLGTLHLGTFSHVCAVSGTPLAAGL